MRLLVLALAVTLGLLAGCSHSGCTDRVDSCCDCGGVGPWSQGNTDPPVDDGGPAFYDASLFDVQVNDATLDSEPGDGAADGLDASDGGDVGDAEGG